MHIQPQLRRAGSMVSLYLLIDSYLCGLPKVYTIVFILLCFCSSNIWGTYDFMNNFTNRCMNLIYYILLRCTLMYLGASMSNFLKCFELMLKGVFNQRLNSWASLRLQERQHNKPFTFFPLLIYFLLFRSSAIIFWNFYIFA